MRTQIQSGGSYYDENETSILDRYKFYNGTEGNSFPADGTGENYSTAARTVPDVEDIDQDNTMNENESYFQYKISLRQTDMNVGDNYIVDSRTVEIPLRNGTPGTNGKITSTVTSKEITATSDYSYLGPIGASNKGNINGNGVIKDDGTKLSTNASTNSDGKGAVVNADNSAWTLNCEWWNYEEKRGEAWILEFSTAGISTTQLSLQFGVMNWAVTGPRYWRIEWSTHGDANATWDLIGNYSVPGAIFPIIKILRGLNSPKRETISIQFLSTTVH